MGKKLKNYEDGVIHGMVLAARVAWRRSDFDIAFDILERSGVTEMQPREFEEADRPMINSFKREMRKRVTDAVPAWE